MAVLLPMAIPVLALRDRFVGKRRPPWSERFAREFPHIEPGGLWIHAVSVGEVEVARRLIDELENKTVNNSIVVTSTTATGLAMARRNLSDRATILASPVDLPVAVGRMFDAVKPRALILVETELWPEMLHQAGCRKVPVIAVNARLSDASFKRYSRVKSVLRPLLEPISLVLTRDEKDADRFRALGIEDGRVKVGGNVKYDFEPDRRPLEWDESIEEWASGRPVIVAGSTLEDEERQVLDSLQMLPDNLRPLVIMAPRHPERFDSVARLIEERGLTLVKRSLLPESRVEDVDVFLLDAIGELARAFKHGRIAFIGGSLVPSGGHNPLEPAVWGVPVLSGPWVSNFEEVYREMVIAGGAKIVADTTALGTSLQEWLVAPDIAKKAGEAGRLAVEKNRGATARIAAEIFARLERDEFG